MNGAIDWIVEHSLAGVLSRACGSYSALAAIVIGALGAFLVTIGQGLTGDPHYGNLSIPLLGAGGVLVAIAGLMGHGKTPTTSTSAKVGILILALCIPLSLQAQTVTPTTTQACTGLCFTVSSGPAAVNYKGNWSVASITREHFDLLDWGTTKANHLDIQGLELLAPGPGVSMYMGGVAVRPNLANLFTHTNLPAGSLSVFADGNIGVGQLPSGTSHVGWSAGGGIAAKFNGSLQWTPMTAQFVRVGATNFYTMSTELKYIFSGKQ
jgi:hypothetical protein